MIRRAVATLLILAFALGFGSLFLANPPPAPDRVDPAGGERLVETLIVTPRDYQVRISSYGTVRPRTQSQLIAQVRGQVVAIGANFRPGGFFSTGDVLVAIDSRDYEADVEIARRELMDALQAQAREDSQAEQARVDWGRLGESGEAPSDLVLRKPQLRAARARVAAAEAALAKAELNLERTQVQAPFSGRLLTQLVDVGQVVSAGTPLAEAYASDYVEVRLPLRNADLAFIDLPEGDAGAPLPVAIHSRLGEPRTWPGRIVRTEGAIDQNSRQLHVVAQIDNPFGTVAAAAGDGSSRPKADRPLKIGEYVTAEIAGQRLSDALVIPSEAIYQNTYAYVLEAGVLQRHEVAIAWQNGIDSLVASGLSPGDALVTTPLGVVTSGVRVRVATEGAGRLGGGLAERSE